MKSKAPIVLSVITVILSLACILLSRAPGPIKFEPEALPSAQVGAAYEAKIQVSENDTPVGGFWLSEGALPAGVELIKVDGEEDTAKISGIPTEAGTFRFTVSAWCYGTNAAGQTGEKEYSIVVAE